MERSQGSDPVRTVKTVRHAQVAQDAIARLRRQIAAGEPPDPRTTARLACSLDHLAAEGDASAAVLIVLQAELERLLAELRPALDAAGEALRELAGRTQANAAYGQAAATPPR